MPAIIAATVLGTVPMVLERSKKLDQQKLPIVYIAGPR